MLKIDGRRTGGGAGGRVAGPRIGSKRKQRFSQESLTGASPIWLEVDEQVQDILVQERHDLFSLLQCCPA